MDCQTSDKKIYKVYDGSKRKRTRKKDLEGSNSVATIESISVCQGNNGRSMSGKASLQDLPAGAIDGMPDGDSPRYRKRGSCTSIDMSRSPRSPPRERHSSRSPLSSQRHRRSTRDGKSLALNAGLTSSPRSVTPHGDEINETIPQDQDSFVYAFLEDAIKQAKKKNRHSHSRRREERREERRETRDREPSGSREHRHRHRRHHDSRERDKHLREESHSPKINQEVLLDTFAKICDRMNEKNVQAPKSIVTRTHSHKSLQCEVASRHNFSEERHTVNAVKQRSFDKLRDIDRTSGQEIYQKPSREKISTEWQSFDRGSKVVSKMDLNRDRHAENRYREYPPENVPTRTYLNPKDRPPYRDYDRERYEDDRRRRQLCEQKTSRSFDVRREYDDERYKNSSRSESRRFEPKYYERPCEPDRSKERSRRHVERSDRNSVVSRDELRDRDKFSERERDSGLSVADGEISTVSGRSNYLRVVKQEITEQREAMDKMMKLWKELMRCFKGTTQPPDITKNNKTTNELSDNMQESATAQLRLWRECMRRYETVARDVGDTDARLMEEINKQRSEMAEMATMWQECLQRYRDMSNDFNTLKKKLATPPESPTRLPVVPPPLTCAEGEGSIVAPQYRFPPSFSQMPPPSSPGYPCPAGSALRGRASAPPGPPPGWWWGAGHESPRRRSSPDSRGSRDRERERERDRDRDRHRHKDAREERYKGKSSKPSGARSEHRHRKR